MLTSDSVDVMHGWVAKKKPFMEFYLTNRMQGSLKNPEHPIYSKHKFYHRRRRAYLLASIQGILVPDNDGRTALNLFHVHWDTSLL